MTGTVRGVQLGCRAMAEIKKVGIVGCGLMGHGIAQVAATAGYDVVVREVDDATLDKGLGKIEKQLARAVEKGKTTPGGRRRDPRPPAGHHRATTTWPTATSSSRRSPRTSA